MIVPRQARDEHRENAQKRDDRFLAVGTIVAIREFAVVVGAVLAVTILKEPMDCCKVHVLEISSTTRFLPACFLLPASCFLLPATCHLLPPFCFLLSSCPLPARCCCFLPPASCHLLPASFFLLPPTCFLLPASCHLLPASFFLPATRPLLLLPPTCFLLLLI
jgi:hypothetical protein